MRQNSRHFLLLKLRQAALDDAIDEVNNLFAAVFIISLHNHVHQTVGQVGVSRLSELVKTNLQSFTENGGAGLDNPTSFP